MISLDFCCDRCGQTFRPTPPGPGKIHLNRYWKPISSRAVVSHRITMCWTGFRVQAQGRDLDICPSCWQQLATQLVETWSAKKSSESSSQPQPSATSVSKS